MPIGSFSRMQKKQPGDNAILELYGAGNSSISSFSLFLFFITFLSLSLFKGDMGISKFFWARRLDQALVGVLDCVKELALSLTPELKLPYTIQDDKINKVSIRLGNDEEWTKACKYMLVDIKWILAHLARS